MPQNSQSEVRPKALIKPQNASSKPEKAMSNATVQRMIVLVNRRIKTARGVAGFFSISCVSAVADMEPHHPNEEGKCPPAFHHRVSSSRSFRFRSNDDFCRFLFSSFPDFA